MMTYTEIHVDPEVVHEEVLEYLRTNLTSFVLPIPTRGHPGVQFNWRERTRGAGKPVNDFVNDVYNHLMSTGRAKTTQKNTNSSDEQTAYNYYYPIQIKFLILEEVLGLVRTGVLVDVKFELVRLESLDFRFDLGEGNLVLTSFGKTTLDTVPK